MLFIYYDDEIAVVYEASPAYVTDCREDVYIRLDYSRQEVAHNFTADLVKPIAAKSLVKLTAVAIKRLEARGLESTI